MQNAKLIALFAVIVSINTCVIGGKTVPFNSLSAGVPGPPGPAGPGTFTEETSIVSVRDYGATGDGITGDRNAIYNAIAAANNRELLFPAGTYRVESDLIFVSTVGFRFLNGAKLVIDSGVTVTINGPLEAGLYQIFSGDGLVNIGKGAVPMVYPQWWGAVGDGVNDDTVAIQSAIDTAEAAGGGVVVLPAGTYKFTGIRIVSGNITLRGQGQSVTILDYTPASGDAITLGDQSYDCEYCTIENVRLNSSNQSSGAAIASRLALSDTIRDFRIRRFFIGGFNSGIVIWTPINGCIDNGRICGNGHNVPGGVGIQLGQDIGHYGSTVTITDVYISSYEKGFWNKFCPGVVMIRPIFEYCGVDGGAAAVEVDRSTTIIEGHWEANYGTGVSTGDRLTLIGSLARPSIVYKNMYGEARLWNHPGTPARSIAYRSTGTQLIPPGAETKIQLNSKYYDQYQENSWDTTANYEFTVPYNAFYLLVASVQYAEPEEQKVYTVRIKVNGATASEARVHASGASPISVQVNTFRSLKAGDRITLYTEHSSNGARDIDYGADKTFLAIISL